MANKHRLYKVALKYCGSCNPRVDLSRLARHLKSLAEKSGDFELVALSENDIDVVVILCGSPRACGNKEEVKAKAKLCIVTAGESVNGKAIPEDQLPAVVERQLIAILGRFK